MVPRCFFSRSLPFGLKDPYSQVDEKLKELENVRIFTDFVHSFTQFGADMVELAHVSGDRQNVSL